MSSLELRCVEGEPFAVDATTRQAMNLALTRAQSQLRSRSWPIREMPNGYVVVQGIVGSLALGDGRTLEIVPKTNPDQEWMSAIVGLLLGEDRIEASGMRRNGMSPWREDLRQFLAFLYAERMEKALKQEGPLLILQRQSLYRPSLRGKLNTSIWLRHALQKPHLFPTEQSNLSADNEFTNAMSYVAKLLASQVKSHDLRTRLLAIHRALTFGLTVQIPGAGVAARNLPSQWVGYRPAWDVAQAVLSRRTLLGLSGLKHGFSIIIEIWPLLERLLSRSLLAAVKCNEKSGVFRELRFPVGDRSKRLLTAIDHSDDRFVIPDGLLFAAEKPLAVLDAKYKDRSGKYQWPSRNDVYQVVTAAATYGAPVAILVYPDAPKVRSWVVEGLSSRPTRLIAIGLDLFSYAPGSGDVSRGEQLLNLLSELDDQPIREFKQTVLQ